MLCRNSLVVFVNLIRIKVNFYEKNLSTKGKEKKNQTRLFKKNAN